MGSHQAAHFFWHCRLCHLRVAELGTHPRQDMRYVFETLSEADPTGLKSFA
jgi:hypothetical protein